jgi:hypothetical protein
MYIYVFTLVLCLQVSFDRAFVSDSAVGYTQFIFTVEIRGRDHAQEIIEALHKQGYTKVECDGM